MNRSFLVLWALIVLFSATVASALGPVTASSGAATGVANTVSVTVPGLVGVDLESDLAWNFNAYNAAPNSTACSGSANMWPISITCAAETATNLNFDPTNNTNPTIGAMPLNADQTTGAQLAALNGNKAVWLAFFCSRSSGTMAITTTMASLTGTATGITVPDFKFKGATSNNTYSVGGTTFTAFADATPVSVPNLGSLPSTFGWTRADQFVTLQLPNTAALGAGSLSSSILFTINK